MKRYFSFVLLLLFLVGCTTLSIQSANLTPAINGCSAGNYENITRSYASDLKPGRYRDLIVNTLSEIAKDIWQLEPKVSDTCQIRYTINYKPSQPISTMDFPVEVSVFLEPAKVCLNHDDFTGTGNGDVRRTQTYKKYPWVYIENKSAPGFGVGRKQFLPVCFDASGEIKGYRND